MLMQNPTNHINRRDLDSAALSLVAPWVPVSRALPLAIKIIAMVLAENAAGDVDGLSMAAVDITDDECTIQFKPDQNNKNAYLRFLCLRKALAHKTDNGTLTGTSSEKLAAVVSISKAYYQFILCGDSDP